MSGVLQLFDSIANAAMSIQTDFVLTPQSKGNTLKQNRRLKHSDFEEIFVFDRFS